jgi:hypothetical protein
MKKLTSNVKTRESRETPTTRTESDVVLRLAKKEI